MTRPTVVVLCALVVMTALRVLHLLELQAHSPFFEQPMVDALEYLTEARERAAGTWTEQVPMHGPLYPLLLGVAHVLCGGDAFWLHLLSSLSGQATVAVLYFGGRRVVGAWPAAAAAVLCAFYRPGLLYECEYYAEGLANLAVVGVGLLLAGGGAPSWRRCVALGVTLGLAAVTRTNLLVLLPVALLVLRRAGWRRLVVVTALALLPAGYYTARNAALTGDFILVQARGGQNLSMANHEGSDGTVDIRPGPRFEAVRRRPFVEAEAYGHAAQDAFHRARLYAFVTGHPGEFALLVLRKAWNSLSPVEAPSAYDNEGNAEFSWVLRLWLPGFGFVFPLALLGMLRRSADDAARLPLLLVVLGVWATMLLVFPTGRYRYQLAGLLCLFAGRGLDALRGGVARRGGVALRGGASLRQCGLVLLAGGLLAWTAPRFDAWRDRWRAEFDVLLAYAYLGRGELDRARARVEAAVRRVPEDPWARYLRGVLASHGTNGQPGGPGARLNEAVAHYTEAIERFGDFPEAFENRAFIHMHHGDLDAALRGYERAVELAPFHGQAWQNLARIWQSKGDPARARMCAQKAAEAQERAARMPWVR